MSNTPSVNIIGTCPSPIWRLGSPKCDDRNNSFSYLSTTPVTPLFSELRSRHRLSSLSPHSHRSARSSPTLRRRSGALQSSLSLPSSLTQKCERGLLNGPDRRWRWPRRPRGQQRAGEDDFAAAATATAAKGNKSTYCTHSIYKERRTTSRATNHRKGRRKGRIGKKRRRRQDPFHFLFQSYFFFLPFYKEGANSLIIAHNT